MKDLVFNPCAKIVKYDGGGPSYYDLHELVGSTFSTPNRPHIRRTVTSANFSSLNLFYEEYNSQTMDTRRGSCQWRSFYRWHTGKRDGSVMPAGDYLVRDANGACRCAGELTREELLVELKRTIDLIEEMDGAVSTVSNMIDAWREN